MFSSTSSPRLFSSSGSFLSGASTHLRLGLIAPRITVALTPLTPIIQSSLKPTAMRLGKVNPPARCQSRRPQPPCPSGSLQTGSPRTPKDSLTCLLSQAGPLEGLRPCWLRAGSPPAPWPIFSPDGVASVWVPSARGPPNTADCLSSNRVITAGVSCP